MASLYNGEQAGGTWKLVCYYDVFFVTELVPGEMIEKETRTLELVLYVHKDTLIMFYAVSLFNRVLVYTTIVPCSTSYIFANLKLWIFDCGSIFTASV